MIHGTILLALLGVAMAIVATIAMIMSRQSARLSRAFRRDPLDWHPGSVFPPELVRPELEDKRQIQARIEVPKSWARGGPQPGIDSIAQSGAKPLRRVGRVTQNKSDTKERTL